MQVFYAKGRQNTNFMSDKPLYVNNCGFYKELEQDIAVNRPSGREDYHILLASSGKIAVNGAELTSGMLYLFYPSSPQRYVYHSGEGSEYFWIHFSGARVGALLESYGICEGVINIGFSRGEVERIIKMMLRAISEKYRYADDFCEGLLSSLLALIGAPPSVSSPYFKAVRMLGDPSDTTSVEEIASSYNMSPNHFIRSFKQYLGMSPNAYRIKKRMEMAEALLVSTDMSIGEVSVAVGYNDPLYFSRAFKKQTGESPSDYRRDRGDDFI